MREREAVKIFVEDMRPYKTIVVVEEGEDYHFTSTKNRVIGIKRDVPHGVYMVPDSVFGSRYEWVRAQTEDPRAEFPGAQYIGYDAYLCTRETEKSVSVIEKLYLVWRSRGKGYYAVIEKPKIQDIDWIFEKARELKIKKLRLYI